MDTNKQNNWLGRLALSAKQAVSSRDEPALVSRPTVQELHELSRGRLPQLQRERVCAWLNQHPDEYEQWLAQPQTATSGWRALRQWLFPMPLLLGSAAALLLAIFMLQQPQPQSDWMDGALHTAQRQYTPQLQTDLQLPWEQSLGFASAQGQPWQHAFTQGVLDARANLLATSKPSTEPGSAWYEYGRLNVVLSVWAAQTESEGVADWAAAQQLLRDLPLQPPQTEAVQRLQGHLQAVQKRESGRSRFELARELREQREHFAVAPDHEAGTQ